ncbi:MAG: hypothetical protein H0V80_07235, partial [Acidobacteria bacterium]|nr:hypothetical protein [Acidobacteriota bacterium]
MLESLSALVPSVIALTEPAIATSPAAGPLWSTTSQISLASLSLLEVVLGIDNVIFIAI